MAKPPKFTVEFRWPRGGQAQFDVRTVSGERVIVMLASDSERPTYQPLVSGEATRVLTAFARIGEKDLSPGAREELVLQFAATHGPYTATGIDQRYLLHRGRGKRPVRKGSIKGDAILEIVERARAVNRILELAASGDQGSLASAMETFGQSNLFMPLDLRVVPALDSDAQSRMVLVPQNLLGAISYILADRLANGTAFRRCRWCKDFFEVGEGTGRTLKREYCSVPHRRKMAVKLRDLRAKTRRSVSQDEPLSKAALAAMKKFSFKGVSYQYRPKKGSKTT